jgi:hypothetical protein
LNGEYRRGGTHAARRIRQKRANARDWGVMLAQWAPRDTSWPDLFNAFVVARAVSEHHVHSLFMN